MKSGDDRVLIIVGGATETVDTLYPFLRLQEDGFVPVVSGRTWHDHGRYMKHWIELLHSERVRRKAAA